VGIWCGADEAEVESHEKQDASPAPAVVPAGERPHSGLLEHLGDHPTFKGLI
jgi:hypothetical protein